jgi:putative cell wall-binding protein
MPALARPARPRHAALRTAAAAVAAVLPAALLAAAPAEAHHDAQARSGDYRQIVTITFPTDPGRTSFSDSYHAPRSGGRVHKATDLMGPKLTPLYAAADGTVCHITGVSDPMPTWGYSLTICEDTPTGVRRHRYIHLNNDHPGTDDGRGGPEWAYAPGIRRGVAVRAGQWVGYMGDSGNAETTAPHLHYEILDDTVTDPYGDHRIDPAPSLRAALADGRTAPAGQRPVPPTPLARVSGGDRVATAVAASRTAWPGADGAEVAVLADSTVPEDALVAGPLAGRHGGPVLLTHPDQPLHPDTAAELRRLGAGTVVLVGRAARNDRLDAGLAAAGIATVERITGSSDAHTAALVAAAVWEGSSERGRAALLAEPGRGWPDALMASWLGAATATPVLLTGAASLPGSTAATLAGVRAVTIVGGDGAISDAVADAVRLAAGSRAEVRRLAGATRYETAAAVTGAAHRRGSDPTWVWAATGRNWPDAITAGPAVARSGDVLVLIDGTDPTAGADAAAGRWLFANAPEIHHGRVLGGDAAVGAAAAERLAHRTRGR